MGLLAGLISMVGWGIADFLAAKSSRNVGVLRTLFFAQLVGFLAIGAYFILTAELPKIEEKEIIVALALSFIYVGGFLLFYKSLEIGPVSVVSPICASYGMVAVVLSVLFLGEVLSSKQISGVILVILGVILASTNLKEVFSKGLKVSSKGTIFAIFAMISWGVFYTFLTSLVDKWGWFFAALITRIFLLFFLFLYSLLFKQTLLFKPTRSVAFLIFGIGISEVIATLSYNIGIEKDLTAIVAPVSATFPLITIILANIFLKERLIFNQYLGVAFTIFGLVLLAL